MPRFFTLFLLLVLITGCNVRKIAGRMYSTNITKAPYDAVIVPGTAYDTAKLVKSGFNARILWACKLYRQGIAKNIIFSGAACYSPYVEGTAMKLIAHSLGVPNENIYCETQAQHSKENVYYSWLMAHKLGFKKLALAADPYQSFFLEGFIQTNLPEMGILPIPVDSMKNYYVAIPSADVSSAHVTDFIPLNKRESFWTRVKHTNHNNLPALPE